MNAMNAKEKNTKNSGPTATPITRHANTIYGPTILPRNANPTIHGPIPTAAATMDDITTATAVTS